MTQVRVQNSEVANRLATLGLNEGELAQAVMRGILARSEVTPNHPPLYAGFVTWGTTVCALREVLIPKGWKRNDEGNYSTVVHPSLTFAIAVATGDENTGNPSANPMTKSPKGPSTRSAVALNILNQSLLFPELPVLSTNEDGDRLTWILLISHVDGKVRSELSLPINCDGKIDGWQERIILPDTDLDPAQSMSIDPVMPNLPDIDIDVRRKA
jgi:hypothetical protein